MHVVMRRSSNNLKLQFTVVCLVVICVGFYFQLSTYIQRYSLKTICSTNKSLQDEQNGQTSNVKYVIAMNSTCTNCIERTITLLKKCKINPIIVQGETKTYGQGWLINIGIRKLSENRSLRCIGVINDETRFEFFDNFATCNIPLFFCFSKMCENSFEYNLHCCSIVANSIDWKKINGFSNKILSKQDLYDDLFSRFNKFNMIRSHTQFQFNPKKRNEHINIIESIKFRININKSESVMLGDEGLNSIYFDIAEANIVLLHATRQKCKTFYFRSMCVNITRPSLKTELLVGVLSSYKNTDKRDAIRQTWKRFAGDWRLTFILGLPFGHKEKFENRTYGDMTLVHNLDRYYGVNSVLPLKTSALYWIANDEKVSWVLKTDDDSFVDIPRILHLTEFLGKPVYGGYIWNTSMPIRDPNSISYISREQWKRYVYPKYASGAGYILSADILPCFLSKIKQVEQMPREDVFSGLLAQHCKIEPKQIPDFTDMAVQKEKAIIQHEIKTKEKMNSIWVNKTNNGLFYNNTE